MANADDFLDGKSDSFDNQSVDAFLDGKTDQLNPQSKFKSDAGSLVSQLTSDPIGTFRKYMANPTGSLAQTALSTAGTLAGIPGSDAVANYISQNPEKIANLGPFVGGALGAPLGLGGATAGAMIGQGLKDYDLQALGSADGAKSVAEQFKNMGVTGLEALPADALAAAIKAYHALKGAGQMMGNVERSAGIIDSVPEVRPTASNLGTTLKTLEQALGDGSIQDAQGAKDALNLLKDIRENPKLYGMTKIATAQINRMWPQAENLVSKFVDEANAAHIASGAMPSRYELVKQAAQYFGLKKPASVAGSIMNTLAGNPLKTAGTSATAASLIAIWKLLAH